MTNSECFNEMGETELSAEWKMNNKKQISKEIDDFLTFLREIEQRHSISLSLEQDMNDETQDILHIIEFEEIGQAEKDILYNKLREIRQKRRTAKEYVLTTTAVVSWTEENRGFIKGLEKLLGEVRKAERYNQNKIFTPRTGIAEEIFNTNYKEEQ